MRRTRVFSIKKCVRCKVGKDYPWQERRFLLRCSSPVKSLVQMQHSKLGVAASEDAYVIGPGDKLSIDLWKEPDLSKQVTVRLDGKISLPLIADVVAGGLTSAALRTELTQKYGQYVDAPVVSVTVLESLSKKIYLVGKVAKPGEYLLQKNMTVVQAISLAGGLTEWADRSDIRLIRKVKGVEKTFRVNYKAIVFGEDVSQNIQLEPDDTIFVP
jgi:polysaccharide export outer membrane protein